MTYIFIALAVGFLAFFFLDWPIGWYIVGMLPLLAILFVVNVVRTAREFKRQARKTAPPEVHARITALQPSYQSRAESWFDGEAAHHSGTLALTSDALVFLDWETPREVRIPLAEITRVATARRYPAGERKLGRFVIGSGSSIHTMVIDWHGGSAQWWVANRAEWRANLALVTPAA